ncbi:50S ribosomal protein L27 [Candidatus Nesciobacter abundans]|uniref:Large ribosomal subunit protein bL27 n=1 Tax=Candidatus Nesciobacter abundans TaxID=2601668 RepID=A0A5C0UGE5_9PROT|nr:50S ribosomal protein L27 [Candidatus Nesciobacter abundans]QEK39186.1 50S ribosomal protein L27 [Candidatus Nesciobacter abundans]
MAYHGSGGSTRNGRDSAGKRLGFKIFGDQKVRSGAIILRQRGTRFFSGENTGIGRDHTVFSKVDGLVKISTKRGRKIISVNRV